MKLTERENEVFQTIALQLNVDPGNLYKLINFESGWNPQAKNPLSSARGLIQFTDSTARDLGFDNSLDLVDKNPSIVSQLPIVKRYLDRYRPYSTKQSLYMSVFYPAARYLNPLAELPEVVRKYNPGINTVQDYINKVDGIDKIKSIGGLAAIALLITGILFIKKFI